MAELRILIVGAGIAGLALAGALERHAMTVDVVDRDSAYRTDGAGLYLPANAVRALHRLGLGPEVTRRAQPIKRQRLLDHRGRVLTQFDVATIWGDVGGCCAISRSDLQEVLRAAVDPSAIRLGTAVSGVAADNTVTFADSSEQAYDLVVGADGVGSAVRRSAFGGAEPRFLEQICWRFIANERASTGWTARLGSRGRTFLTISLGDSRMYCYAAINSATPTPPSGDWRTLFADFAAPVPELLEQATGAYFAPLSEIDNGDWVRPRVVLIGDAAHACSPSMAQGVAMALEDVIVLTEVLTGAANAAAPTDLGAVLRAYQARRTGRIRWVLEQNRRRDNARNLPTPVRNLTMRLAGQRLFKANHAPLHAQP